MIVELVEGEYKVVCFPTQYYCNRTLFNKTEDFNIYPIYDGTIVNVYYSLLENKWLFGTHKSFNICENPAGVILALQAICFCIPTFSPVSADCTQHTYPVYEE